MGKVPGFSSWTIGQKAYHSKWEVSVGTKSLSIDHNFETFHGPMSQIISKLSSIFICFFPTEDSHF